MAPPRRYHIVFNERSGAAIGLKLVGDALRERCACWGAIELTSEDRLEMAIARALESDADVIVSAGGDGTATALAGALAGSRKALALLPLGTANVLARDLSIPLELDAAIEAIPRFVPRKIDVGEVNGEVFLHQVVIGVLPAIAAAREKVRGKADPRAYLSFVGQAMKRFADSRRIAIAIASRDTVDRVERVRAISVANNSFDEGLGKVFSRSRLDAGTLTLYILKHLGFPDVLRLAAEMLAGRWLEDQALATETVRSLTIRSRKPAVSAMVDGEVRLLKTPLNFRIRPLDLTVLAPPQDTSPGRDTAAVVSSEAST